LRRNSKNHPEKSGPINLPANFTKGGRQRWIFGYSANERNTNYVELKYYSNSSRKALEAHTLKRKAQFKFPTDWLLVFRRKTQRQSKYGRLNGKQHAKARKNARFDGAIL
jgi:hypothetical protein